jgi:predicted nucleic acid-binding protein
MRPVVLDASALLAMLFGEKGMDEVRALFKRAAEADSALMMCSVNYAEVLYKVAQRKGEEGLKIVRTIERTMPLEVVAAGLEHAEAAADLKMRYGLGLADAFAAALTKTEKAELVAADHDFQAAAGEFKLRLLG